MNLHFSTNDMQRVKQDWINWWTGTIDHPFFGMEAIDDAVAGTPFQYNDVTPVETDSSTTWISFSVSTIYVGSNGSPVPGNLNRKNGWMCSRRFVALVSSARCMSAGLGW